MMYSVAQVKAARELVALTQQRINKIYNMDIKLIIEGMDSKNIQLESICDEVCVALEFRRKSYTVKTRERRFVDLRFVCVHIIGIFCPDVSEQEIAELFGLDRTTIINARQQSQNLIETHNQAFIKKCKTASNHIIEWMGEK